MYATFIMTTRKSQISINNVVNKHFRVQFHGLFYSTGKSTIYSYKLTQCKSFTRKLNALSLIAFAKQATLFMQITH